MYRFLPLTWDDLLEGELSEQLETALTDLAFALRQEGVATDSKGNAKARLGLAFELECDVHSGHLRLNAGLTGTPVKLRKFVKVVEVVDGLLHVQVDESAPRQATMVEDPGRELRQAEASSARRAALEELASRRSRRSAGDLPPAADDDPAPDSAEPTQALAVVQ